MFDVFVYFYLFIFMLELWKVFSAALREVSLCYCLRICLTGFALYGLVVVVLSFVL